MIGAEAEGEEDEDMRDNKGDEEEDYEKKFKTVISIGFE